MFYTAFTHQQSSPPYRGEGGNLKLTIHTHVTFMIHTQDPELKSLLQPHEFFGYIKSISNQDGSTTRTREVLHCINQSPAAPGDAWVLGLVREGDADEVVEVHISRGTIRLKCIRYKRGLLQGEVRTNTP